MLVWDEGFVGLRTPPVLSERFLEEIMGPLSLVQCGLPTRQDIGGQEEGMGPAALPLSLLSWLSSKLAHSGPCASHIRPR